MIYSRKLLISLLPNIAEVTDDEMITACGSIGTEIENIYKHPKLNNLVIGKLLSFEKHPNADKLNVCKVQINQAGTIHTIVCGASNLVAEKNVIVALEGAKLFDGRVIDYRELRGVRSEGMLCGYYELTPYNEGFVSSKDDEGIMLFDDGTIGDKNVAEFLGLNDTIYDISVPFANRNDLNGALSICQELSGYFG
jgi:phenylalanyl-tRNA synthetase beta chain